jgi:hypothetical protein
VSARQRGGEGLGREVGRDLGVPHAAEEVAEHAVLVAAVEGPEGAGLRTSKLEQRLVRDRLVRPGWVG